MIHLTKKRFPAIFDSQKFRNMLNLIDRALHRGTGKRPEVLNLEHAHSFDRCVTSGRLQSVLVTDWSDANTIKSDKPEKKHEAWRKDNNKPKFCGNMRLQGKYYKQKPSVRFTWKAMKEGKGRALEIFSVVKISLAIVCHLERAELTKLQEVLKMVLRSKAQKESIIRSKRGNTVQESPSSTTSPGVGSEKKKEQGQLLGTYVTQFFLLIKLMCVLTLAPATTQR